MASTAPTYTGTGANYNDGGNVAWTNPTNVQGDTTSTAATCNPGTINYTSQRLRCSNFGFTIPEANTTIDGITVEVEQYAATASRERWKSCKLLIAGAEAGSDLSDAAAIPKSKAFKTFGGSAILWGLTPTPAQVNASGFGVSLKIEQYSSNSAIVSFYRVRITVAYTTVSYDKSGSFALSGKGAITATGRKDSKGSFALSDKGNNTITAKKGGIGSFLLSGSGNLVFTGGMLIEKEGSFALSGGGGLAFTGNKGGAGSFTLSNTGTLAFIGSKSIIGSFELSGGGNLSFTGMAYIINYDRAGSFILSGKGNQLFTGIKYIRPVYRYVIRGNRITGRGKRH